MARWLKRGRDAGAVAEDDAKISAAVEMMLVDIQARGDKAVRELSIRFDKWDRADYRLTDAEIRGCLAELSARAIEDIKFAQAQVRSAAGRVGPHRRGLLAPVHARGLRRSRRAGEHPRAEVRRPQHPLCDGGGVTPLPSPLVGEADSAEGRAGGGRRAWSALPTKSPTRAAAGRGPDGSPWPCPCG